MKKLLCIIVAYCFVLAPAYAVPSAPSKCSMPYAQAGLTPVQASAHLLSRFTYGATPGQVEAVAAGGLDTWFLSQMQPAGSDPALQARLADYPALSMSCREIADTFLPRNKVLAQAEADGVMVKSDRQKLKDDPEMREKLKDYARSKGFKNEREMLRDLVAQKMIRSVYAKDQLREVLTDFWYNHFNVSTTKPQARDYILAYERDAIRPHVLDSFRDLLGATAKHPAMLYYLDNAQSVVNADKPSLAQMQGGGPRPQAGGKKQRGLNENYARELLELHTMGVDGGYTQQDVIEVARCLTGWTAYPSGRAGQRIAQQLARAQKMGAKVIQQGDFIFLAMLHDAGPKHILGRNFPGNRGLDEGEEVLDMLAQQPATAHFISKKLVTRFVSDTPDPVLVEKVAQSYLHNHGDIKKVLITIVESPEFWAPAARQAKIKSPLEYSSSMMRAVGADVNQANQQQYYTWLQKMGQPLYGYQAPTGFPDRAEQWVNSGTLVQRINFAFALVANKIPGITVNTAVVLASTAGTAKQRLEKTAQKLLPGRNSKATADQVADNLNNPKFFTGLSKDKEVGFAPAVLNENQKIVGVLLSSPEFQRR